MKIIENRTMLDSYMSAQHYKVYAVRENEVEYVRELDATENNIKMYIVLNQDQAKSYFYLKPKMIWNFDQIREIENALDILEATMGKITHKVYYDIYPEKNLFAVYQYLLSKFNNFRIIGGGSWNYGYERTGQITYCVNDAYYNYSIWFRYVDFGYLRYEIDYYKKDGTKETKRVKEERNNRIKYLEENIIKVLESENAITPEEYKQTLIQKWEQKNDL